MRVNDTMYAFEHNAYGDVVGIFDTEGNLMVKYSYNAWGVPIEIVDGNGTDVSRDRTHVANKNPYRYRGYYYDVETGLYYLKPGIMIQLPADLSIKTAYLEQTKIYIRITYLHIALITRPI